MLVNAARMKCCIYQTSRDTKVFNFSLRNKGADCCVTSVCMSVCPFCMSVLYNYLFYGKDFHEKTSLYWR